MQTKSKVETYLGFAIKKRALITGCDSVARLKKANLVVLCATASENAKKQAQSISKKLNCYLIESKIPLEDVTGKLNCKIAAVTDENLASAIVNNLNENFSVISGGNVR